MTIRRRSNLSTKLKSHARARDAERQRMRRSLGRTLTLETLESRQVMAAEVQVRFEFTDTLGSVAQALEVGNDYTLSVYVRDMRGAPTGVSQAYFDFGYDFGLIATAGAVGHANSAFQSAPSGTTTTVGLIDEAGGADTDSTAPSPASLEQLLVSIPIHASGTGTLNLTTNLATDSGHSVLLFGSGSALPLSSIQTVGDSITIQAASIIITPTSGLTTTEAGGTATATVVLSRQPSANVSFNLISTDATEGTVSPAAMTFTPANWNVPQTVTMTGVDDTIDDDDQLYIIFTDAAVSADTRYNGLNPPDLLVQNIDNEVAGVAVSRTSGVVTTEAGGTDTFTLTLMTPPTADVVVGLSSSDTSEGTVSTPSVTFTPANWNIPQTITVTGVDDAIADGNVAYSINFAPTASTDPKYNGLSTSSVTVTNQDDAGETAGFIVAPIAGLVTTEAGGVATFNISLKTQPTADVTIGLSSDNLGEGFVQPTSVTFTAANWNVAQVVTVIGVDDMIDDGDVSYTILTASAISADSGYSGLNPADVAVTNQDDPTDVAGITITPSAGLFTTEAGGTASFLAVLDTQPLADVTVTFTSSDTTEGTVGPAFVTFTPADWNIPRTITVTGVDDAIDDDNVSYSIVTSAATSSDPKYSGLDPVDVQVTNTDTPGETASISVIPTVGLTTTEAGGTATFVVVLNTQPTADVTIGLSSSDTTEGTVSPVLLTFTPANWNVQQTVTVTGVDDALDDDDVNYQIITAAAVSTDVKYSGMDAANVSLVNTDDATDVAGVTVTPTSGLTTTEAGGTATFTIVLNSQPTADVTIGLSSSDTTEGTVGPSSVTFTPQNWNVPQTITATGVSDVFDDGDIAYSILVGTTASTDPKYDGIVVADVSVTNMDDPADVAGVTVSPISGLTTTEAGGTATFTVVLNTQPLADVVVDLSSNNTAEGTVSVGSITFTTANWNVPRVVTVTGVDDILNDGDIAYSIITAPTVSLDPLYSGINPADVSVTNLDDDSPGILVTPTSGLETTEAGGTASFTVVLRAPPTSNVTIGLISSDTTEGTIAVSSLVFTPANWNIPQTVTITGQDDPQADGDIAYSIITAAAVSSDLGYNGLDAADVAVTNKDGVNDVPGIIVTPTTGLVTNETGATASFTIALNTQPTADVTISLSSSNTAEGTVGPASVTFTPVNWNTPQTITVTGVDDAIDDGDVAYTIVTAAAVSTDTNYSGLNAADVAVTNQDGVGDVAGITVTPTSGLTTSEAGTSTTFTIVLNTQPTANVTIGLSSSNASEGTVGPNSVTFTPANWNVPQTVTVTGVADAIDDDNVAYSIITAAAVSSDLKYNGLDASDVSLTNTDTSPNAAVQFGSTTLSLTEGGSTTTTVVLASQPTANVTVALVAANASQISLSTPSIVFTPANWNVPVTITVTGTNDSVVEATKTIAINSTVTSLDAKYQALTPPAITTTLADDDTATITLTAVNATQAEGSGSGTTPFTFRATSSAAIEGGFRIAYTTNDGTATVANLDYTDNDGTLIFTGSAGEQQTITVLVTQDTTLETDETFTVALGAISNVDSTMSSRLTVAGSPVTGTIQNDDSRTLTITNVSQAEGSGTGTTSYTFNVTLTGTATGSFTVAYTTNDGTATVADSDYVDNDGTLTFTGTSGETKTITVVVNRDAKVEKDETFNVTLTPISGVTIVGSPATGTITNDDTATVSFASATSQVLEQAGSGSINVRLDIPGGGTLSDAVTVAITNLNTGTATTPGDYTLTTTSVVFPAGSTNGATQPVNFTLVSDATTENAETIKLQLGSVSGNLSSVVTVGATSAADVTIVDDPSTAVLSGFVWADVNGNGTKDSGETGIPGVVVTLSGTDLRSRVVQITVMTDANGAYRFANLPGGTYDITETQPASFTDGAEALGKVDTTASGTVGADKFTGIVLGATTQGTNYNFGETSVKIEHISRRLFIASQLGSTNYVRNVVATGEAVAGNTTKATIVSQNQMAEVRRIDNQVTVTTSDVADTIVFTPANSTQATDSTKHTVEVNGVPFQFPASEVPNFQFLGGSGGAQDVVQLRDSRGNDTLKTSGSSAVLSSTDYKAEAIAFELVKAISSSGGTDQKTQESAIDYVLQLEGNWTS